MDKKSTGLFSTHGKDIPLYNDPSKKSTGGGIQIFSPELKDNATFTPL